MLFRVARWPENLRGSCRELASNVRIMFKHMRPNAVDVIIVMAEIESELPGDGRNQVPSVVWLIPAGAGMKGVEARSIWPSPWAGRAQRYPPDAAFGWGEYRNWSSAPGVRLRHSRCWSTIP